MHTCGCDDKRFSDNWWCNVRREEPATTSDFSGTGDVTDAGTSVELLLHSKYIHICPVMPWDSLVRFIGERPQNSNDNRCNRNDFDWLPRGSLGRIVENCDALPARYPSAAAYSIE